MQQSNSFTLETNSQLKTVRYIIIKEYQLSYIYILFWLLFIFDNWIKIIFKTGQRGRSWFRFKSTIVYWKSIQTRHQYSKQRPISFDPLEHLSSAKELTFSPPLSKSSIEICTTYRRRISLQFQLSWLYGCFRNRSNNS